MQSNPKQPVPLVEANDSRTASDKAVVCKELLGKYTLLYSQRATGLRAANRARTNDGREVKYTCMVDESEFGDWKDNYKWDDARVVGYMDSYSQITHVSPPEEMWPRYFLPNAELCGVASKPKGTQ